MMEKIVFFFFTEETTNERSERWRLVREALAVSHREPVERNAERQSGIVHQRVGVLVLGHARQYEEAQLRAVICRFGAGILHHDRTGKEK